MSKFNEFYNMLLKTTLHYGIPMNPYLKKKFVIPRHHSYYDVFFFESRIDLDWSHFL